MAEELALIPDAGEVGNLPDAAQALLLLVEEHRADLIDEVRRRAEAASLYEKRRHNLKGERGYGTLRLLSKAAIGILAFDEPQLLRQHNLTYQAAWKALAAAFERDVLLNIISKTEETLTTTRVAERIRNAGYTSVPGRVFDRPDESIPWSTARKLAREQNMDLTALPPDQAAIRRRRAHEEQMSRRMLETYRARARDDRRQRRAEVQHKVKEHGPLTTEAYALLRKTLLALHDAQQEFTKKTRKTHIDLAFHHLYEAEREISNALGFSFPGEEDPRYAIIGSDEG